MHEIDFKSAQILDSALPVFIRFGFQKTTMSDIARAAGISRASLYLCFKSKEELFRAGSIRAHSRTLNDVAATLGRSGPIFDRISAAIFVFQDGLIAPFGGSDNAEELFAANMKLARDVAIDARTRLLDLLANALVEAEKNQEVDLKVLGSQPADLAALIAAAMDGIKHSHGTGPELKRGTFLFIDLLKLATAPSSS